MKCNEQRATTEQGNHRQEGAGAEITAPTRIGCKIQISHAAHMADAQKGPEQERSRDENGTMKERFEIVLYQKGKQTVRCKRLG